MAKETKDDSQIALARELQHVPWCDQYERMISGMLYNAFTPVLADARFRARKWAHNYNHYFPDEATDKTLQSARTEKLNQILGRLEGAGEGEEACIEPPMYIDYGCNISLGRRFYAGFGLTILDCGLVTIGDRVMMGPSVSIYTATHEVEVQSRRDDIEFAKPVTIGNDCWIGGGAIILPGVNIGEGCTIGSGAVVTKDVPAWSVAVGSPARVVKKVKVLDPVVR